MKWFFGILLTSLVAISIGLDYQATAACASSTDISRGVVTASINIESGGSYRVWTRMKAVNVGDDSFVLEIGEHCIVVGDSGVPAEGWKWVDYRDGQPGYKVNLELSAGQHTVRLIGREDSVKVDKLLFLLDQSCQPTGFGDNCEPVQSDGPRCDFNGDGSVGVIDLSILLGNYNNSVQPVGAKGDCNGANDQPDGFVNLLDLVKMLNLWTLN